MQSNRKPLSQGAFREWFGKGIRVVVIVFLPWLALYKSRSQLHLAALIIRNTARCRRTEDATMLRWADELEHDGWLIWKPHDWQ